jgi:proline iminopeptidase
MQSAEGYMTTPDGVRLYFHKAGNGPEVICPNGIYLLEDFKGLMEERTFIFYDVRNRGRSDTVTDPAKLEGGILQDAEDLEAIRQYFGLEAVDIVAHSYIGLIATSYAKKYPQRVKSLLLLGSSPPDALKTYPPHLMNGDSVMGEVFGAIGAYQKEVMASGQAQNPEELCKKFWELLRPLYVVNPYDAKKLNWQRCDLPNERNFMLYYNQRILPSIHKLRFSAEDFEGMRAQVLLVHGNRDRSAAYGGARDWVKLFPNARLLTVENAAHAPWVEAPDIVLPALRGFLEGRWPENTVSGEEPSRQSA